MAEAASGLKWGVEKRLEFIEFRLYWDGSVNRSDLMDMFDVSVPQASKDFALYAERAPGNAVYDARLKRYVAGPAFTPRFMKLDTAEYFSRLRARIDGLVEPAQSWIRAAPEAAVVPTPSRALDPEVLRNMLDAIREAEAVEIFYQSFSTPEPSWRWIAPHALGFDGFRWHARAYDERRGEFVDFVLARIAEVRGRRTSEIDPATDTDWTETATLVIAPNPGLPAAQQAAIAADYDMTDGRAEVRVRRAFVYYAKQRLGLGEGHAERAPKDQHIVLLAEG